MRALRNRNGQTATEYVLMLGLLTGIGMWLFYVLNGPNGSIATARDTAVQTIPND